MKKLNTLEDIKKFTYSFEKILKEKNIDIKHSAVLEAVAQSLGAKDWNTLSVTLAPQQNKKENIDWDHTQYYHIDNGGYKLFYSASKELLRLEIGFFGYSYHTQEFYMTLESLDKIRKDIIALSQLEDDEPAQQKFFKQSASNAHKDADTTFVFLSEHLYTFENNVSKVDITHTHHLLDFTQKVLKNDVLPLTTALLSSMALRFDHGFGLMKKQEQNEALKDMKNLYYLYAQGLSDADIEKKTKIHEVSVRQLREEVSGVGFYDPNKSSKKKVEFF